MAVPFQRFLAGAQARVIPNQTNQQEIKTLLDTLVPVIDLTAQSRRVQRGEATHTMVASVFPRFTFPIVPVDEIHVYHFLGVDNTTGGSTSWNVEVQYPQFTQLQVESFNVDQGTMINMLTVPAPSNARSGRAGRPFTVWPEGIMRLQPTVAETIGDVLTLGFIREIVGGAATSENVSTIVVDSEQ